MRGLNFKIKGIKQRWMIKSLVVSLLIVVVGVSAYGIAIHSYYYTGIQNSLETKAGTATDFFANYITKTFAEYYQSAYRYTEKFDDRDKLELQFINTSGRVEVSTYGITAGTSPSTPDITEAIKNKTMSSWRGKNPITGERIIAVSSPMIYPHGQVVGVMRYVSSLKAVDRQVTLNIVAAIAVGVSIILLFLFTNMYFIRSIVTPVREVTKMTRQIAEGGYGGKIENKYDDELGEMVESINEMSMKISQSEKVKTEFISSVSHELRTPLTAIAGWGETLMYDENMSEDSQRGVAIILKQTRLLANMVEELLDFTRIEDGRFTVNMEPVDIEAELEDALLTYSELFRQENMTLEYVSVSSAEQLPVIQGDPERLKQVFSNLLDNAVKYGKGGGKLVVSIALEKEYEDTGKDYVKITIRDYGPGIPPDELPHVKYKFYKGSSKERGSGIGLAVCEEIVKRHNGFLNIENAPDKGIIVTILLPVTIGN
jgi:signal transduction histidine kinase